MVATVCAACFGEVSGDVRFFAFEASVTYNSGITHIDRITDCDVAVDECFHVASIIFVDSVHNITFIIGNI